MSYKYVVGGGPAEVTELDPTMQHKRDLDYPGVWNLLELLFLVERNPGQIRDFVKDRFSALREDRKSEVLSALDRQMYSKTLLQGMVGLLDLDDALVICVSRDLVSLTKQSSAVVEIRLTIHGQAEVLLERWRQSA